ncbi:hypothetical protein [Luteimonas abyssi]|uniref:hypothetical protein n=1 Tax=Luteimonas abyssi TaxID=1247514 RepID=UPI0012FC94C3|nr:hypothetical protein [Luteimonas abyssi]
MFERSEFGQRAPSSEKRRAPIGRSPIGSRPAKAILLTFVATKVSRASARKLLILLLLRLLPISVMACYGRSERHEQDQERFARCRARVPF